MKTIIINDACTMTVEKFGVAGYTATITEEVFAVDGETGELTDETQTETKIIRTNQSGAGLWCGDKQMLGTGQFTARTRAAFVNHIKADVA